MRSTCIKLAQLQVGEDASPAETKHALSQLASGSRAVQDPIRLRLNRRLDMTELSDVILTEQCQLNTDTRPLGCYFVLFAIGLLHIEVLLARWLLPASASARR